MCAPHTRMGQKERSSEGADPRTGNTVARLQNRASPKKQQTKFDHAVAIENAVPTTELAADPRTGLSNRYPLRPCWNLFLAFGVSELHWWTSTVSSAVAIPSRPWYSTESKVSTKTHNVNTVTSTSTGTFVTTPTPTARDLWLASRQAAPSDEGGLCRASVAICGLQRQKASSSFSPSLPWISLGVGTSGIANYIVFESALHSYQRRSLAWTGLLADWGMTFQEMSWKRKRK